ncbi:TPA: VirB3 family type IV secretion system protein [Klebsiella quasipneumoniae subsp. quasipneumoniae]|nr:VirB3 family type IV secretion system protein [Klebsiella quasipneumoniae subsp. quasipneumoniae]
MDKEEIQAAEELNAVYLTYNGLNRPAMIRGIPLIPFILCFLALLISFFIGVLTIGFYGLIIPSFIIGVMIAIKQICADDPNAMSVKVLKIKGWCLKGFRTNNVLKVE